MGHINALLHCQQGPLLAGIAVTLMFSLTNCGFGLGNQQINVGNVLMILACAPLIAATRLAR